MVRYRVVLPRRLFVFPRGATLKVVSRVYAYPWHQLVDWSGKVYMVFIPTLVALSNPTHYRERWQRRSPLAESTLDG